MATVLLAACTGSGGDDDATNAALDASALLAWQELADRLAAGETLPETEFDALYDRPAYRRGFGVTRRQDFNRPRLERAMRSVFQPDPPPDRTNNPALVDNFRYLATRRDAVLRLGDDLAAQHLASDVASRVRPYLPADGRPDSLRILLLAATPSVSWRPPDLLVVDAGLALAAGAELPHLLSADLYRRLAAEPVPTDAVDGRQALVASLTKLKRRGVAAHLRGGAWTTFDAEHPVLGQAASEAAHPPVSDIMGRLQTMLATLSDPAQAEMLQRNGASVDDYLRPGGLYDTLGAAMARLIHGHLDAADWRIAAAGDTHDWFTAYQAAAAHAVGPDPLPPFSDGAWSHLQALLASTNSREVSP